MTDKAFIDIGGNVWVDVMAIVVVQPRTIDGDPLKKIPGCAVFLTGDNEPVYGEDSVTDVIATVRRASGDTRHPIRLADLDASEYDSLIVETMDQRNNALWLLKQVVNLNEEAHRDDWSALALYSGIRALIKNVDAA